jgi:hypothetical protein
VVRNKRKREGGKGKKGEKSKWWWRMMGFFAIAKSSKLLPKPPRFGLP